MSQEYTLSVCLFEDLEPYYSKDVTIPNLDESAIRSALKEIVDDCQEDDRSRSGFFDSLTKSETNSIVYELVNDHYYVWNRYNKYYVILFAIDYTGCEIYSKDYNKEVFNWEGKSREIKGMIDNDDYNENPVVTLFNNLGI